MRLGRGAMFRPGKGTILIIVIVVAFIGFTFLMGESELRGLIIARPAASEMLDPIQTVWDGDTMVTNLIYEPLMTFDENMNRIPMLAENWYYGEDEDGMYYEFKLRENVTFHCGYPFTSEAVYYTIWRAKTHPNSKQREATEKIKDVKVLDKYTVRIYLTEEDRYLLDKLTMHSIPMVCPHCAEKYGDDFGLTHTCGTGPFKLKEWSQGDRLVLERYEDYNWGPEIYNNKGPAKLEGITFLVVAEDSVREAMLERGDIDFVTHVRASYDLLEDWRNSPDIQLYIHSGNSWVYIRFNCAGTENLGYGELSEKSVPKKVRQAIAYAIDENDMIERALAGAAAPIHSWLADTVPGSIGYQEEMYPYDPDMARQLLADAGYPDGIELGLLYYDDPNYARVAAVLAEQLADVGITLNIQQVAYTDFQSKVANKDFNMILKGWTWPFADSLWYGWHTCRIPSPNRSWWGDDYTDQVMLDTYLLDDNVAFDAIYEAQWLIADDAAAISIYNRPIKMAHRTYVKGFKIHPQAYNCWHFLDTYIEE